MNHTITMNESDIHEIGDLSIRISVGQTIHDADQITVYGWNNSADLDDEFGDYEVEVATITMSESDLAAYNDNTRHALTFTLTQQQIDDALALFNETYLTD